MARPANRPANAGSAARSRRASPECIHDPDAVLWVVGARPTRQGHSITLTATEVAELLGLDTKTVYAAARRGEIPCRRVGRRYVFGRRAIESWLGATSLPERAKIVPPTSRRRKTTR